MPAVTRRPYRPRSESVRILEEILAASPLDTGQICEVAHVNRVTCLGWLHEAARARRVYRMNPGSKPGIWSLAPPTAMPSQPLRCVEFRRILRSLDPRRWYSSRELGRRHPILEELVAEDLLETCRRWYLGRPGPRETLYKLTVKGEIEAGHTPALFPFDDLRNAV